MAAILDWALLIAQVLFAIGALGTLVAFKGSWDFRNLLAAVTFGGAALASQQLTAWWPLVLGFGLLWVFKLMGMDPGDEYRRR
jgi:hypothetical protein